MLQKLYNLKNHATNETKKSGKESACKPWNLNQTSTIPIYLVHAIRILNVWREFRVWLSFRSNCFFFIYFDGIWRYMKMNWKRDSFLLLSSNLWSCVQQFKHGHNDNDLNNCMWAIIQWFRYFSLNGQQWTVHTQNS